MDISRIRALRGPNLWSRHTAMEAILACTEAERALTTLPGFETRLRSLSYGGSSIIITMAAAGILINIARSQGMAVPTRTSAESATGAAAR